MVNPVLLLLISCLIGSGGSRIHVFEWEPRIFDSAPPPVSFPKSNEKWTDRIAPGIDSFAYDDDPTQLTSYLAYLINSAKTTLKDYQTDWYTYPIYLRATGNSRPIFFFV